MDQVCVSLGGGQVKEGHPSVTDRMMKPLSSSSHPHHLFTHCDQTPLEALTHTQEHTHTHTNTQVTECASEIFSPQKFCLHKLGPLDPRWRPPSPKEQGGC